MSNPKPLSVSISPSLAPAAARAAAQDAQIAELVQQNRTLEHSLAQLRIQLQTEKTRCVDAVNQIKAKHRLAHLGTRVALEHERGLRLDDKEALTREKTARLLREYKLILFQAKETDLVAQVAGLEDELEIQREEFDLVIAQHEAEIARLSADLSKSETRRQARAEELGDFAQEKEELEAKLTTLHVSSASGAKQVERLTLQLETLRTQNTTIENRNRELQHQVDKWQSLEGKGEKEVERLHKRRIELEVRVKELEVSLKETRSSEKKIDKLEASLLEIQEQVERGQQEMAEAQAEAQQALKQAAKLHAALETEKKRSADALIKEKAKVRDSAKQPPSLARSRVPSIIEEVSEGSGSESVDLAPAKPRSRNQKSTSTRKEKHSTKGKSQQNAEPVYSELETEPQGVMSKGKGQGNPAKTLEDGEVVEVEDGEVLEVEEEEVQPKKRGQPRERDEDRDVEVEELPLPKPKPKKPRSINDDLEAAKKPQYNKTKKAMREDDHEQEIRSKKRSRSKPPSAAGTTKPSSVRTEATDEQEGAQEQDQAPKKKKRKLNVTGGTSVFSGPAAFTWDQDGHADLGINIPTVLSPVKDGEPVPSRSTSNSLLGGWKLWGTS